jgi:hypothetical protein
MTTEATLYHAITLFIQNGKVFDAATRGIALTSLPPKQEEVCKHLEEILSDNCNAQWGRDFEIPSRLELGELSAEEVASRLTDPLNNLPASDITYTILTRFSVLNAEFEKDGSMQEEAEMLGEFERWCQHSDNQCLGIRTKTIRRN